MNIDYELFAAKEDMKRQQEFQRIMIESIKTQQRAFWKHFTFGWLAKYL